MKITSINQVHKHSPEHLNAHIVNIAHMTQMTKRIPLSEERWKELGKLKEAGQTYDDLMGELIQAHNRQQLAKKMDAAERGEGEWVPLEKA